MKFVRLHHVNWINKQTSGYTLYGLTENGEIFKSIPQLGSPQHVGWLKLNAEEVPANYETTANNFYTEKRIDRARKEVEQAEARLQRAKTQLAEATMETSPAQTENRDIVRSTQPAFARRASAR